MPVIMPMIVPMSTMRMSMIERENAHEVHDETEKTDKQEAIGIHLGWMHQALDGLKDDREGDEDEEDAVGEAREGLNAVIAKSANLQSIWLVCQFDIGQNRHAAVNKPTYNAYP